MAEEIAQNISPMHDPDVFNSLSNEFDELIRSIGYKHQSCIPAMVEDYDRETHMATVRPLVKYTNYDGESTPWPAFNVSVWRWQWGGFLIDVPLFRGDVGWVIAADRDTQNAKEMNSKIQEKDTCKVKEGKLDYGKGNQGPQIVQNFSMHKWSYGFFIPDSWSSIKISDEYKDNFLMLPIDKDGKDHGFISIDHETVITVKKTIKVKVTGEGGAVVEKEVPVTIQIDPKDLGDKPDGEMRIRDATIPRVFESPDGDGKTYKDWHGKVLCTEGSFGEDSDLGGASLTYNTGNLSNLAFSESLDGPYQPSLKPKGSQLFVNVYYV